MAAPLKNLFNRSVYETFTRVISRFYPGFEKQRFIEEIFNDNWENLELKQRARHTSLTLNQFLFSDFEKDIELLISVINAIRQDKTLKPGIESMFVPDYVEVFGIDYPEKSLIFMEEITKFFSCEFAIRPFLLKYPEKTLAKMKQWAYNPDPSVRRLSSEGCRPRLPWAMAIPFLKKDPTPILPILETLKNDPAETVRKSVANNLNDISKDNPGIVIELVKKWKGQTKNTDWVLKHASRTLLKQAHWEVLELFGYGSLDKILVEDFQVLTPIVKMGDSLEFRFSLTNTSSKPLLIRLEYGVYYLRANGSHSKKVFKISEKKYLAGQSVQLSRKQSFKPITTRKYYQGLHRVSLIVNGREGDQADFELS